jgi:hypothetical protein
VDAPALGKLIASPPLAAGAPAPSRLQVLRHAAWRDAQAKVDELGRHAREAKVFVFPIWYAVAGAWSPATVIAFEDGSYDVREGVTPGPVVLMAVVEDSRAAIVDDAKNYAPDVALPLRNRYYVAIVVRRIERIAGIERIIDAPGISKPRREVAAGAVDAELAVAVGDLDIGELLGKVVGRLRRPRSGG